MKTIFKVGMEVYDQVNNPNKKGKILDIKEDEFCKKIHSYDYPIEVQFEGEKNLDYYDLEGRPVWSVNPTLSTAPYTLQGFEQKAPAPTIEEALDWFNSDEFKNLSSPDKSSIDKIDKQIKAFRELLILRDYYNKGEVFNRVDFHGGGVYSVTLEDGKGTYFEIEKVCHAAYPFTFWDKETAKRFMNEQSLLLSIAEPLL